MTYEELCNMETELKNKQLEFIKSTLAHNNGKVELEYRIQSEFNDNIDAYYDQFPCVIVADGRHGEFSIDITCVFEKNGKLFCYGRNRDDDNFEQNVPIYPESYSTIAYFLHYLTTNNNIQ